MMPASDTPHQYTESAIPATVTVSEICDPLFIEKKVTVQLLRLDQIDPVLSGNKLFKLIPNLAQARAAGLDTVVSFGGAYSNHIHALAEAGYRFNFKTIGIIRGNDGQSDSHTLKFAASRGMRLIRVSREDYRRRNEGQFVSDLLQLPDDFYLIPEGGANEPGMRGSMQLAAVIADSLAAHELQQPMPDEILLACGTGTTMAGLIAGMGNLYASGRMPLQNSMPLIRGIAVLKQGEFLRHDISRFLKSLCVCGDATLRWQMETSYHWGGYARFPPALEAFMQQFEREQGILLDPVYTAKVMSAVYQRIAADLYQPGARLLILHTGGLQGRMDNCSNYQS